MTGRNEAAWIDGLTEEREEWPTHPGAGNLFRNRVGKDTRGRCCRHKLFLETRVRERHDAKLGQTLHIIRVGDRVVRTHGSRPDGLTVPPPCRDDPDARA